MFLFALSMSVKIIVSIFYLIFKTKCMKIFYGIFYFDFKALKNFIQQLPAASSNAIHR